MRLRHLLRAAVIVTTVLVVGVALRFHWRIESRWERMAEAADAFQTRLMARKARRPVLHGQEVAGHAWDDYTAALTAMPEAQNGRGTNARNCELVQLRLAAGARRHGGTAMEPTAWRWTTG